MDPIHFTERLLLAALRRVQEISRRRVPDDGRRVRDSHRFWNDPETTDLKTIMHWRGEGPFEDEEVWFDLGRRHREMLERASRWAELALPAEGIVEWGSGGGMNAVAIAPLGSPFYAVDLNEASLEECVRQVEAESAGLCVPVLIDAESPEAAIARIDGSCDLFFSSYVFELIPSPGYGLRIMRIAYDLLRPGGVALIQVRYHSGIRPVSGSRRAYERNWVSSTSYTIDGFWQSCEGIGFEPMYVTLVPVQPELDESRYAYFALKR
ncbi:MAG: class I SAM-dependent methyltransferase [marine benthic group bacterium]|jgi:SAM-dependent methyltransferase|nr:class I SAM-dependent methyltransferase [Gemmatimonadota bacterium]